MLTSGDWKTLAACQAELLAWDGSCTIQEHFLNVLPRLIESQVFIYQSFDFKKNRTELLACGEIPDFEKLAPVFYAHIGEHPLIQATRADGHLPAMRISDLLSREAFERTGLYNEFYRKVGFSNQLALSLPARRGDVIGLVYSRNMDFTDRERDLLNLARTHVLQMYRQAKRFESLLNKLRLLHSMIDALDEGVLALNETLRIEQSNRRASDMLRRHFNFKVHRAMRRQLPQPLLDWVVRAAKTGRPGRGLSLQTAAGPMRARLCRMNKGWLLKLEEPMTVGLGEGFAHLGLTPRESEVLRHLALGKSNTAIAAELQASHRTIEKHVEHILMKLKVSSRAAAAAMAHRGDGEKWEMLRKPSES